MQLVGVLGVGLFAGALGFLCSTLGVIVCFGGFARAPFSTCQLETSVGANTGGKVRAQDPIFGDEVLILEQEFLVDQSGDVG